VLTNNDKREIVEIIKRYRGAVGGSGLRLSFLGRIPILSTAPAPVTGVMSMWINAAHYAVGTETLMNNGIQLVFPDGTNMGISLPFSSIPS
jgi:hypothetical protein